MKTKHFFLLVSLFVAVLLGVLAFRSDERNFEISKQLNIYASLFRETNMFYVDEVEPEKLVTQSIHSMLKNLDPYTVYYTEAETEDVKIMTTGEYAGIGAVISKKGDDVIIRTPYKDFPAYKAGLLSGDIILSLDGSSVKGKSLDEVSESLKGSPGKELRITVKRAGENKPIEKNIIREKIQIPSIPYAGIIENNIGYINLNSFIDKSAAEMRKAAIELKSQGITSLILDLRGNGGGLLDQAVDICNFFLPKGTLIVSTKGKVSQWDKEYYTNNHPMLPDMPLVILIDRISASAAEIVAGALQDNDRAVIIGDRSFGKGLVQTVRDLPYNTKMKITTAKYYIPSGRCIQAVDYSHRNPDGSVGNIPDSLVTEHTTKAGRKVFGGGGIMPDLQLPRDTFARITQELVLRDLCFDFVNAYATTNRNIPTPQDFRITDEIFTQFKQYLKEKDFSYETGSQRMLDALEKAAKKEKYYELIAGDIEKLSGMLTHSIDRDADLFRDEIAEFLADTFMQRYYCTEGTIQYGILHDKEVKKAIEILSDSESYENILKSE